jgi:alkylhydroperoxidase family enzyme
MAFFAEKAQLTSHMQYSLVHGKAEDECWSNKERALIRGCDQLHRSCDLDDILWSELSEAFTECALLEFVLLAGFYRTVSYLTNALRLPLEPYAERFHNITK